jgi:hypothetical protein
MTHAVVVAALVALAGAAVALAFLPSFPPAPTEQLNDLAVAAARALPSAPAQGRPRLADASLGLLSEAGHASLNFNAISGQSGVATGAMQRGWRGRHQAVVTGLDQVAAMALGPHLARPAQAGSAVSRKP